MQTLLVSSCYCIPRNQLISSRRLLTLEDGYADLGIWSAAEPVVGILGCCLLTYGPLLKRFRQRFGLTELGSDASNPTAASKHDGRDGTKVTFRSNAGYSRNRDSETFELTEVADNGNFSFGRAASVHCESTESATEDQQMSKDSIYVKYNVSVV